MKFLIFFAIVLMNALSTNIEAQIAGVEWTHGRDIVCFDDPIGDLDSFNPNPVVFDSYKPRCFKVSTTVNVLYKKDSSRVQAGEIRSLILPPDDASRFYGLPLNNFKDEESIQTLASQLIIHKIFYGSFRHDDREQTIDNLFNGYILYESIGHKCKDISDSLKINGIERVSTCSTIHPIPIYNNSKLYPNPTYNRDNSNYHYNGWTR